MIKHIIFTVGIILWHTYSFAQWEWYNPLPQGNILNSATFTGEETIFAAGHCGTIMKSTNQGHSWSILQQITTLNINDIEFRGKNQGFAACDSGLILLTNDGGQSWTSIQTPTFNDLHAVSFSDSSELTAVGTHNTILRSTDAGNSWELLSSPVVASYYDVSFPDKKRGIIVGRNSDDKAVILHSTDAGTSWQITVYGIFSFLYSVSFPGQFTGYASGMDGVVLKTIDGGLSWDIKPNTENSFLKLLFINQDTGIAINPYYEIFRTTDGAAHWENITPEGMQYSKTIAQNPADELLACGSGGFLAISTNVGESWSELSKGIKEIFHQIEFVNETCGFILGSKILQKSTDGGVSWNTFNITGLDYGNAIASSFIDESTGYVLGGSGEIIRTFDGGITWEKVRQATKAQWFSDIYMIDKNNGFMTGGGVSPGGATWSTVYRSTTGVNWQSMNVPSEKPLNRVYFYNRQLGFMLGWDGTLLKTLNGGLSWTSIQTGIDSDLQDVFFLNPDTGFMIASGYWDDYYILKSENGGEDWTVVYEQLNYYHYYSYKSVFFSDPFNGWVSGCPGLILTTQDCGKTWTKSHVITDNYLNGIYMKNAENGMIVGSNGTILVKGSMQSIREYEIHDELNISCIPNPARKQAVLSFELSSRGLADILIYDSKGGIVKAIRRKFFQEGLQQVQLDVTDLSAGLYTIAIKTTRAKGQTRLVVVQ